MTFTFNNMTDKVVAVLAAAMTIACILWNLGAPIHLGFAVLSQQYMAFQLGLALTICYLKFGWKAEAKTGGIGVLDGILAVATFVALMYAAWDFAWLLKEQSYRPWQITVIGAIVTVAVMEGVRRRAGWMLFSIVAVFLVYSLFAENVPGRLIGKSLTPVRLVQYVGFDPNAVFSSPLAIGTMVIVLFVFFGQLLFAAGGGTFFTDLAMAATGRSRGGSAKISVVGSALFGSISGSAVANVVTTGVVTIPLMKRGGYSSKDAGAVEAVASTGGQLAPPIMGAAAFLMAEFLEIPYMTVAIAALIPALLYYFSLFVQVDLIAGRDGIRNSDTDTMTMREVMMKGWHFLLPFGLLLVALFWWRMDPEVSALVASVAIIVVGFIRDYRGERLTFRGLARIFVDTGVSMVDLILVVAAAGFIIGILNITGLGFALTLMLVDAVGSNPINLLLMSAVICIILGMGMPTSGVYVLLAALIAPSIVEAGIRPIAAHMFILYFGMLSMITPPVALAAFAAAAISKSNALATAWASVRLGWAAFLLPFLFVATPALLMNDSWDEIVYASVVSVAGVFAISIAVTGYWSRRLGMPARILFAAAGLVALPIGLLPEPKWVHIPAAVACLLLVFLVSFQTRRAALHAA